AVWAQAYVVDPTKTVKVLGSDRGRQPTHRCYQPPTNAYTACVPFGGTTSRVTRRAAAWSGFGWGCIGGATLVALMYWGGAIIGLRPLPQLLNEPILSLMPGFVFGFLIDTLQHAGKRSEEHTSELQSP